MLDVFENGSIRINTAEVEYSRGRSKVMQRAPARLLVKQSRKTCPEVMETLADAVVQRVDEATGAGESLCALDHAARGSATLDDIARPMRMSRERIRQIENGALLKLRDAQHGDNLLQGWGGQGR